ncbi:amidohydrolase [Marinimicrobium alkaliphilum]|uniref:amidohydrolase n=1 Tax=Marinimicrobium alkaliphilum TaxID=2202654 RepID=UPI000DBA7A2C|nr:amidohydrolase [Marinimicrobium alkaliphilum]
MTDNLRLTLLQDSLIPEDPAANLARWDRHLAGCGDADLVVLPEVFTTGFCPGARAHAERPNGKAYRWMAEWAARLDTVITGSLVVQVGNAYVNRLVWMRPDGDYQEYDKRHLFRMAGEHERYAMGRERLVVEWRGWRILPLICYDLRFPVWSRNRDDYDLALYVANWPAARRLHWQRLLQARAIENLSVVVGVNRIGADTQGQEYSGDSAVYGADGRTLLEAKAEAGAFSVNLVLGELDTYRSAFPAHLDADSFSLDIEE